MYSSVVLCVAMICLLPSTNANYHWWSVGVNEISKQSSDSFATIDCDSLSGIFSQQDIDYCEGNKALVQLTAIGTRNGIIHCQNLFDNYQWNCTTFQGENLFGNFINEGTKETALISSLLAMTSAKQISISCRDEIIPDCTCTIQGINGFYDGSTKTYGCDDDPSFGKLAMNKFLNDTEELSTDATARRRVEIHNHNVGMELLQERNETCRCAGLSGSCAVQSCYFKAPDPDEMKDKIISLYLSAVKVELNTDSTGLVPTNSKAVFDDTRLGYVSESPSFCTTDTSEGIMGSENRRCVLDDESPDRCSVLCCGRGYYTINEYHIERTCDFVYCCYVECTETQVTVQEHYCNEPSPASSS